MEDFPSEKCEKIVILETCYAMLQFLASDDRVYACLRDMLSVLDAKDPLDLPSLLSLVLVVVPLPLIGFFAVQN